MNSLKSDVGSVISSLFAKLPERSFLGGFIRVDHSSRKLDRPTLRGHAELLVKQEIRSSSISNSNDSTDTVHAVRARMANCAQDLPTLKIYFINLDI